MRKCPSNKKGFSLVEALLAIAIFIFILLALVIIYASYTKVYNYQQETVRVAGSARLAMNEIQSHALQASHIVQDRSFSGTVYGSDEDALVLEIPAIDESGDIISGQFDWVVFYKSGNSLYRLVEADADSRRTSGLTELSGAVETLSFSYNNADLSLASQVEMDIQVRTTTRGQTITHHLHQEIYLRNL